MRTLYRHFYLLIIPFGICACSPRVPGCQENEIREIVYSDYNLDKKIWLLQELHTCSDSGEVMRECALALEEISTGNLGYLDEVRKKQRIMEYIKSHQTNPYAFTLNGLLYYDTITVHNGNLIINMAEDILHYDAWFDRQIDTSSVQKEITWTFDSLGSFIFDERLQKDTIKLLQK